MKKDIETKFVTILKKAGHRITKPRLFVLSFLYKSKNPVSAKEIIKNMHNKKIDQVTVYRILDTLKNDGIVNQINFQENCAYFELKDNKSDHHHIICTKCKKINDFTGCQYKVLANKALTKTPDFNNVTNHSFEFFGICNLCIGKN